jgi:hypothetical protein
MQEVIGVTKIQDGIVYAHNKKIGVLEVTPMNFTIKTETDQQGVISSFQKFLNSLDFPVQICINSTPINLSDYLEKLKERVKSKQRYEEFAEFLTNKISSDKMRNRRFFLIIPESANLEIQLE